MSDARNEAPKGAARRGAGRRVAARQRRLGPTAGVTILEVLIVLTIIALISAVAGPRLVGYLGRAKSETAQLQIAEIRNALDLFYVDLGRYPTGAEGLAALVNAPADGSWDGPYLRSADALTDPWDRAYLYEEPSGADAPDVVSLGRDGARGGTGEDADLAS